MIANLNNVIGYGISQGKPYLSPEYWYEVLNALHCEYASSDSESSFSDWTNKNWNIRLIMSTDRKNAMVEAVEFDSTALTALLLRFPR